MSSCALLAVQAVATQGAFCIEPYDMQQSICYAIILSSVVPSYFEVIVGLYIIKQAELVFEAIKHIIRAI